MPFFCRSVLLISLSATPVLALEGRPVGGAVYNLSLGKRINFYCAASSDTEMRCDFTETTVSYQLEPEKRAERLIEELKDIDKPGAVEEFATGSCEAIEKLEAARAAGEVEELDYMPQDDVTAMLAAFRNVCEQRSKEAVEAFMSYNLDIQTRTCVINTLEWSGNFAKSSESTWVRTDKDPPNSDGCGGIYLDRFELGEDGFMWNLVTRSISSNPNGTFTTGEKCNVIYPDKEVLYEWSSVDFPMRCDYIKINIY